METRPKTSGRSDAPSRARADTVAGNDTIEGVVQRPRAKPSRSATSMQAGLKGSPVAGLLALMVDAMRRSIGFEWLLSGVRTNSWNDLDGRTPAAAFA